MKRNELTLVKMYVRYNETVVDFILGLPDVLKVAEIYRQPLATNVILELRSRGALVPLVNKSLLSQCNECIMVT